MGGFVEGTVQKQIVILLSDDEVLVGELWMREGEGGLRLSNRLSTCKNLVLFFFLFLLLFVFQGVNLTFDSSYLHLVLLTILQNNIFQVKATQIRL